VGEAVVSGNGQELDAMGLVDERLLSSRTLGNWY